jgi:DNA-binding NtrC family response regulator
VISLEPLANSRLSRIQLEIFQEARGLTVENVGSASLFLNGREAREISPRVGDVVEVGDILMLLCALRSWPRLSARLVENHAFGAPDAEGIVGETPLAWDLRRELDFAGRQAGHVLVTGPSGAGKELAARALHRASGCTGPLVERNAATIPEGLIDAELFGNLKNYPNPGMSERLGLIGTADGGVLFLDEFAELSRQAQTHLLRVLDAGQYQRLGEARMRTARLRLIAATNRPLSTLREDIVARFALHIRVPPLSARRDDVPLILRHVTTPLIENDPSLSARFLDRFGVPRFSREFLRRVLLHPLSGNVRELKQLALASLAKSNGTELEWFDPHGAEFDVAGATHDEGARIQRSLDANNGSIEKTWRALGLSSRHALVRKLKKHGLVVHKRSR